MKINHIAIYVNDLEKAKHFYQKYFSATANEIYHNKKTSFKSYFLTFEDGARLEIMTRDNLQNRSKETIETGYIHIAISVGSKEKVDSITNLLEKDGYRVIGNPRTTGDGYYESVVLDSEDNQIEIVE